MERNQPEEARQAKNEHDLGRRARINLRRSSHRRSSLRSVTTNISASGSRSNIIPIRPEKEVPIADEKAQEIQYVKFMNSGFEQFELRRGRQYRLYPFSTASGRSRSSGRHCDRSDELRLEHGRPGSSTFATTEAAIWPWLS